MDSDPFNKPAKRHTQECKNAEIHSELRTETNTLSYFKIFNCVKVFFLPSTDLNLRFIL